LTKSLYILRKLRSNISSNYLKMAYYAFFHSHISLVWYSPLGICPKMERGLYLAEKGYKTDARCNSLAFL